MSATEDYLSDELAAAERELERLAAFIMDEVEGEPSRSEGAVDTAIRLLEEREWLMDEYNAAQAEIGRLRAGLRRITLLVESEPLAGPMARDILEGWDVGVERRHRE